MRIFFTPRADKDLAEIWTYLASNNLSAAERVLSDIESKVKLLADNPMLGPVHKAIAAELRFLPAQPYLVLYRILPGFIEIVRIVDGRRDLSALFTES